MIKIITDSTCDLAAELIRTHNIDVVPVHVLWGNEQFLDRVNLQPKDFYARLQSDAVRPMTSQPTVYDFSQAFKRAAREGAEQIVCILVTRALTGTYDSALAAAETSPIPVHLVDSKGCSMMLGWQVLAAAQALREGKIVSEILAAIERIRERIVLMIGLDTLSYVAKGGRVGGAIARLGDRLAVKPLLTMSRDTGKITPLSIFRTHKLMLERLYERFVESVGDLKNLHIAVLHGDALADAEKLAERIRAELNPSELVVTITGPALGVHSGPGTIALCGYSAD